jgi:hypothetical protein
MNDRENLSGLQTEEEYLEWLADKKAQEEYLDYLDELQKGDLKWNGKQQVEVLNKHQQEVTLPDALS